MYADILQEIPQVTTPQECMSTIHHNTYHRVITKSSPIHERPRRLPENLLIAKQFQNMVKLGILNDSIKQTKKSDIIKWNYILVEAFNLSKLDQENASLLTHTVNDATIAVLVDTSNFAMGAILEQQEIDNNDKDIWKPLDYYSKLKHKNNTVRMIENCVQCTQQ
ncbi:unnamed protein product [Macrosiphum euphorbiae]|uniref:Reverse transcriptase/retrotransposon-derived protein RNase H-like domain-containing protein n=1 Tax=Macrosiphum euphorbiae TaxID=13131 RepID=A0AAV0WTE3_9HEMI|nr:unnamed protein product [Macrosiphum euphorbiae]